MAGVGMDTGVNQTPSREEWDQMQKDLTSAAASFNEMRTELSTVKAQMQQATMRESTKSMAHANKPRPFPGHGDTMHLGSWIFTLTKYLEATNADPERWVAFGSTYLIETAAVWYEHRIQDMHVAGVLDSWPSFCKDLIDTFQPITAPAMARDKLHHIKQRGSVQDFNSETRIPEDHHLGT